MPETDPIFSTGSGSPQSDFANGALVYSIFGIKIYQRTIRDLKPDLDPLEIIRKLLENFEQEENINKSKSIASLHRVIENTHARRRLEKWALRVIVCYLIIVLIIVAATYTTIEAIGLPWFKFPPNIMIAILTTTTANIIGLGLIVLRGHFLASEANKKATQPPAST